jgi:PucR C-terminal helix-turn-helix domain/GGDEF-like domain
MTLQTRTGGVLLERVEARRHELERATLARVYGVSDPASVDDPAYVIGLRQAVAAAISYALAAIADRDSPPPPPQLLSQARCAASHGVALDTVLRRYVAGHALLGDFLIGEAGAAGGAVVSKELREALRIEGALFDRLLDAVAAEYANEVESRSRGTDRQRAKLVRALLDGEMIDIADLRYDLEAWHLGLLATGPGAGEALRQLAAALDREILHVQPESGTAWAWLGGHGRLDTDEVVRAAGSGLPATVRLAVGEPGRGLSGWHLTHRQARAALPVARQGRDPVVRYSDVTLLAAALSDEVMASSLHDLYLEPLTHESDGGEALRQTLLAYFRSGRNVSSTAAALGISWPTVKARLDTIEGRIGRSLGACAAEVETALQLQRLASPPPSQLASS